MPTKKNGKIAMARPTKSDDKKLSKVISFRMQMDVFLEFAKQCSDANLTQSELHRDYVTKNRVEVIARPKASSDAKRAVFLLQKASNNLNQLAHRANADSMNNLVSEETYLAVLDQLKQLNQYMLEQVGEAKNDCRN
ncbi:plasmid mobilization relaxosome protein MobC [Massilia scottii]|uniref:plasmid mobilization relaxosome protein MobC n=1 Tax=Massilia scottii TaxID=3057166 RepID=UPI00279652CE|nr:plasmid mobilization relaxosome protein MobC [Massilia sp. CCM 9029]MDQ1835205.1 plasmid mobilization relaxosome protein MobC [Massilia sp. CCM 9029]